MDDDDNDSLSSKNISYDINSKFISSKWETIDDSEKKSITKSKWDNYDDNTIN